MKRLDFLNQDRVASWLTALWYSERKTLSWGTRPLVLLSGLYCCVVFFRKSFYRFRRSRRVFFPVPIVIVGNLSVGGTGKTPLVIWLTQLLQQKGMNPGIVCRGYGATKTRRQGAIVVQRDSDPEEVGDEPRMLYERLGCPVVVASKRALAVKHLLSSFACDVVLSDDGLQHYGLARDIEIAVLDGHRRLGNGFCLPLGPLREPRRRLSEVDFVVCNGPSDPSEFEMKIKALAFVSVCQASIQKPVDFFKGKSIVAVAALGNPLRFFETLKSLGLSFESRVFRDHYHYKASDFDFLQENQVVIMTEKDAVKCRSFSDQRFYYLPVTAELPETFQRLFLEKLAAVTPGGKQGFKFQG